MDWFRLKHTLMLYTKKTGFKRADYIKEKGLFKHVGKSCMFMFRKLPLYGELISVGDNVHIASNVTLITHDVTHNMLNRYNSELKLSEYIGCIEIGDNVFIGANSTILYNSKIPSNTIIGANSFVNKKLTKEGVYAGIPARYICTLDEFLNKRSSYALKVTKSHKRLSDQTINEAWRLFHKESE